MGDDVAANKTSLQGSLTAKMNRKLREVDPEIAEIIRLESERQAKGIELIPSENFVSEAVLEAMGSVLTNKYAEGYPGKRYYGGCEYVDRAEAAGDRSREKTFWSGTRERAGAFRLAGEYVCIYVRAAAGRCSARNESGARRPPHARTSARIFRGRMYKFVAYGVKRDTETIDYDEVARLAEEHKPKMIVAGASAYSRVIDFARFAEVAKSVGAVLFVDMAHIAGLVAAGVHPSPVPHADFVSTTTHKTLRGPRGGLVLCKEKYAKELDKLTFPGIQGGPLMHTIAAKAVCLQEAMEPGFREYQAQVVTNARALAAGMANRGFRIISGGTDNHLFMVDIFARGITGKEAQPALDRAGITVNKNAIPFDPTPPMTAGGIRMGTPAITTRGMNEAEMDRIAGWVVDVLTHISDTGEAARVKKEVEEFTAQFPLYAERWNRAAD